MVKAAGDILSAISGRSFRMGDLWRLAIWGLAAAAALAVAIYASTTPTGRDRVMVALAQTREVVHPSGLKPLDAKEGRQLADSVRGLLAERDRTSMRLTALERGIEATAASIVRLEKLAEDLKKPAEAAGGPAAPPASPTAKDLTSSIDAPHSAPRPQSPAAQAAPSLSQAVPPWSPAR